MAQDRTLANAGVHTDFSYVKGVHNVKIGAMYEQTYLTEDEHFGIVDPKLSCRQFRLPGIGGSGVRESRSVRFDEPEGGSSTTTLTRTSRSLRSFFRTRSPREIGRLILESAGISTTVFPRLAKRNPARALHTKSIQRAPFCESPTRAQWKLPFNENLILSSTGCTSPVLAPLLVCAGGTAIAQPRVAQRISCRH